MNQNLAEVEGPMDFEAIEDFWFGPRRTPATKTPAAIVADPPPPPLKPDPESQIPQGLREDYWW